jgi:hypothetical protein
MTASAPNNEIPVATPPKDPKGAPHTELKTQPVLELNQDVLASSQRRRYLDSLDNSSLAT